MSPFSMNAGMMVCSGRLCGASALGEVGSSVNSAAAIVQDEAGAVGDDAGAKRPSNCFGSARPCCRRDRRCSDRWCRCPCCKRARADVAIRLVRIDQLGALGGEILREKLLRPAAWKISDRRCSGPGRHRPAFSPRSWCAARAVEFSADLSSGNVSMMLSISSAACPGRWAAARRPSSRDRWSRSDRPIRRNNRRNLFRSACRRAAARLRQCVLAISPL